MHVGHASSKNLKKHDLLYFSFLGGVILLQLFWIPGPFRDIGQRNSDKTKIPMNLTLPVCIGTC